MAPLGNIERCVALLVRLNPSGVDLAERYLEMLVAATSNPSALDLLCDLEDRIEVRPEARIKTIETKPDLKTTKNDVKPEKPEGKIKSDVKPEGKIKRDVKPEGKTKNETRPEGKTKTEVQLPSVSLGHRTPEPRGWRIVPAVPRGHHPGLPTLEQALPHRIFSQYSSMVKTGPTYARMFCFAAFIDGFPGFFTDFVVQAPSWCEVCYYELPGSGTRRNETLPETIDELAEDAWQCMLPAFRQMQPGGVAEGCPFAFNGFAISNNLMMLMAARVRAEFGLEPCCVFVCNAAPPSRPFLNPSCRQLVAKGDPEVLSTYVLHIIGWRARVPGTKSGMVFDKVHHHLASFIRLTSDFIDSVDHIFHIFRNPLYIFIDRVGYSKEYEARTYMDYSSWVHWTTEPCEICTIESEAPKATIRYHSEVTSKMWKEFGKCVEPPRAYW